MTPRFAAPFAFYFTWSAAGSRHGDFAVLVRRQIDLVYSTALRQTRNPHAAEEVTQAVFVVLARKAGSLLRLRTLTGWLYQATRLTAANYLHAESRRARRDQEAYMQSLVIEPTESAEEAWTQTAPLLDSAMGELSAADRDAVLLQCTGSFGLTMFK